MKPCELRWTVVGHLRWAEGAFFPLTIPKQSKLILRMCVISYLVLLLVDTLVAVTSLKTAREDPK